MAPTTDKLIVYVDMDDTLCDYESQYTRFKALHPEMPFPQSCEGFFLEMDPMQGAVDTWHWLTEQEALEIFILTAPSVLNPHCYTEKRLWVERYLGLEAAWRLILAPHKGLFKGHFMIDDYTDGRGQEHFEGELIHFGSEAYPNWAAVRSRFEAVGQAILGRPGSPAADDAGDT